MRKIAKTNVPAYLQAFTDGQLAIQPHPVNLTYGDFPHKTLLLQTLTQEQFGLCGYTGAPVDDRMKKLQVKAGGPNLSNHIEHLKCQQACRAEVAARGEDYGRVVADDLNYQNMIAALEVRGTKAEHFGAVAKANKSLPLFPTTEGCGEQFVFSQGDGSVRGTDNAAAGCISMLALNHQTLKGWRLSALSAWFDPETIQSRDDIIGVIQAVTTPTAERLPEFAYVIESVAKGYINENDL